MCILDRIYEKQICKVSYCHILYILIIQKVYLIHTSTSSFIPSVKISFENNSLATSSGLAMFFTRNVRFTCKTLLSASSIISKSYVDFNTTTLDLEYHKNIKITRMCNVLKIGLIHVSLNWTVEHFGIPMNPTLINMIKLSRYESELNQYNNIYCINYLLFNPKAYKTEGR